MAQKAVWVRVPPSAPVIETLGLMPFAGIFLGENMSSKKNILLINPWIYDFTAYDFWLRPLGLLYIAAILERSQNSHLHYIDCLDRQHPRMPGQFQLKTRIDGRGAFHKEEVKKPEPLKMVPRRYSRYGIPLELFLYDLRQLPTPDAVLITCTMTYWYPGVQLVADLIRNEFGKVPIILGGIYATLQPKHARRDSGADVIVQGPGEAIIQPLLKDVLGEKIDFMPYDEDESMGLPSPAVHLLRDRSVLPVLTSRGCPFHCSYCAGPLLYPGFRQAAPDKVVTWLDESCRKYQSRHLAFYDDALLLNKEKHLIPILRGVIEKEIPAVFHTPNGLHIREIDDKLACLFRQANFQSLYLSQEGFEKEIISASSHKVRAGDLEEALLCLERAGYSRKEIKVYMMVGLPGQDFSQIKEDMLQVRRLGAKPYMAYFSPVPRTKEWQRITAKGYIDEAGDPLLQNKLVFPFTQSRFSPEEFQYLKKLTAGGDC